LDVHDLHCVVLLLELAQLVEAGVPGLLLL